MSEVVSKSIRLLFISLVLVSPAGSAAALFDLDYSLILEQHEEEEDRHISDLALKLKDHYVSQKLRLDYDLTTDLVYEHKEELDNVLWSGSANSEYKMSRNISWLLDMNLSELNTLENDQLDEIDRFNSQTLAVASTGFNYLLSEQIRGKFAISLLTRLYDYEESPLNAEENTFSLSYSYPLSSSSDLLTEISLQQQRYDDESQILNDVDTQRLRLEYSKRLSSLSYTIFIQQLSLDYQNRDLTDDVEGYGINVNYALNSRSSLLFSAANEVQQTYSINSSLLDPQNPILISGLVKNQYYTLGYRYSDISTDFSLSAYQNELEDITDSGVLTGIQKGLIVSINQVINRRLSASIDYDASKNPVTKDDSELTTVALRYQISQSRKIRTELNLIAEEGKENEVDNNDRIVQFIFNINLF